MVEQVIPADEVGAVRAEAEAVTAAQGVSRTYQGLHSARFEPYRTEMQVTGAAGSVLLFDSRLWHTIAANTSDRLRVAMVVRYVPWWLNLDVLMPGSEERKRMVEEPGLAENEVPPVPADVYERLPQDVQPLYRHWVR